MKKLICGIDPGFSGAICFYDPLFNSFDYIADMPLVSTGTKHKSGKMKMQLDLYKLSEIVKEYAPHTFYCVIEKVHAMTGQGVSSMFRFGENYGQVQGIVAANDLAAHFTPPSVWKSVLGLSANKKESLEMARKLFPDSKDVFARVKDNGRAEAALIAYYGTRLLGKAF